MSLFSSSQKSNSFLGIDIGTTSVKVVEFKNDQGRAKLVTYGYSETASITDDDSPAGLQNKANLIKSILVKAKTTSSRVITALPTYAVFSSVLTFPATLSKKDLPSAIKWEAKKLIPLPVQEMSLSWNLLPNEEPEKTSPVAATEVQNKKSFFSHRQNKEAAMKGHYQKVLLIGAPNSLVKKYLTIFKLTGLNLMSLETESFALVRALIGNDHNPSMIVNFGSTTTTITVVDKAVAVLNRSIDVGGNNITKLIANSLSISEKKASYFKQDVGLVKGAASGVADMIAQSLTPVVNEIKYTKNVWENQSGQKLVKIVLTGGAANLPDLDIYLSKALEARVFLGDPWARVVYPEPLKPVLNDIGSRMAVAVGLAMRNIV